MRRPSIRASAIAESEGAAMTSHLPNLITIGRLLLVPVRGRHDRAGALGGGVPAVRRWPAFRTPSTASSPAASTCAPSSAPISIRSPTRRCWSRSMSRWRSSAMLPGWLAIVVVSRDVMIVGAVVLSWLMDGRSRSSRLPVSKAQHRRRRSPSRRSFSARDGLRHRARAVRSTRLMLVVAALTDRLGRCLSRRMAAAHDA